MSQKEPTKKLSRHARYNKKRRLEKEQSLTLLMEPNILISPINNIIFDTNRVYIIFNLLLKAVISTSQNIILALGYFLCDRSII